MDAPSPHYTVLARRFRPQTFSEVVGQTHVAQALKNAIAGGRVAHAYLFTGARGVGKTSMARILAKALNCPNASDADPCNVCDICQGIASGHDVDVLEIDGASNRRIDDIRMLRSNVGVKPMRARYKIYIIDEVHMLTNEAFNALLKTLEEPPPNVKFVFCTTEPNKVPDTILSRCQRFDFAPIATQQIVERLHEIATAEGFQAEPAALELVARRAGGSMRDSQSLFDQLLAYGGKSITAEDVHRLLGTASDERLIEIVEGLISRRPDRALQLFDGALAEGVQLGELVDQILAYHRDLMVIAAGAESTALSSVASTHRPTLAEQARRWGLPTVMAALQLLAETKTRMQRSGHGRALAELAIVRLTLLEATIDLATLVNELRSTPAPRAEPKTPPGGSIPRQTSVVRSLPTPGEPAREASPPEVARVKLPLESGREMEFWSQLVLELPVRDLVRDATAKVCNAAIIGPNHLEILFPSAYHVCKALCEQPPTLERLGKLAGELAGRPVRITCRLDSTPVKPLAQPAKPVATRGPGSDRQPSAETNDPYAEKARSIFGGTIVRVEAVSTPKQDPEAVEE
ncbi:MAG TPA: DNA polymerase III subunit gamma/tau [Planctomycetaceae bacterium]|jgi:DNA polymerase-3 subunit gamma/tau|nr:DNA polymerase III subunit gamma/tau [Planctomycetaceae bacterium]